ncbi:MAG: flagellar assembly protein FliW [Candidatus Paracaedibacteraceae bacterium]|nr:flagellar assembly protein FliW [Candidatus Paracaedibacteraceae bacterium]
MQYQSFETTNIPSEHRVIMPNGIIGFNDLKHYILSELNDPFWELKSVEDNTIKFIMMELPNLVLGGISYTETDFTNILSAVDLGINDVKIYTIISIDTNDDGTKSMTVNMRAPFVYHPISYRGWQLVLADPKYPIAQVI